MDIDNRKTQKLVSHIVPRKMLSINLRKPYPSRYILRYSKLFPNFTNRVQPLACSSFNSLINRAQLSLPLSISKSLNHPRLYIIRFVSYTLHRTILVFQYRRSIDNCEERTRTVARWTTAIVSINEINCAI